MLEPNKVQETMMGFRSEPLSRQERFVELYRSYEQAGEHFSRREWTDAFIKAHISKNYHSAYQMLSFFLRRLKKNGHPSYDEKGTTHLYLDTMPPNGALNRSEFISINSKQTWEEKRNGTFKGGLWEGKDRKKKEQPNNSFLDDRLNALRNAIAFKAQHDPNFVASIVALVDNLIINIIK